MDYEITCEKCGKINTYAHLKPGDIGKCLFCGSRTEIPRPLSLLPATSVNETKERSALQSDSSFGGIITALEVLAWINLVASGVAAILVWIEFGKQVRTGYSSLQELSPIGIAIGFAVLFEGVTVFVLFQVIVRTAKLVTSISHKLVRL